MWCCGSALRSIIYNEGLLVRVGFRCGKSSLLLLLLLLPGSSPEVYSALHREALPLPRFFLYCHFTTRSHQRECEQLIDCMRLRATQISGACCRSFKLHVADPVGSNSRYATSSWPSEPDDKAELDDPFICTLRLVTTHLRQAKSVSLAFICRSFEAFPPF